MFAFLGGILGLATGMMVCAFWAGFAMLFGLPMITETQAQGTVIMFGSGSFLIGLVVSFIYGD